MTAEILTIGDEILIGQITNTNSVWLARELNLIGIRIRTMKTVGDSEDAILEAFTSALNSVDFVFITGGLGPTRDDLTKKIYAEFMKVPLALHQPSLDHINSYFSQRGRRIIDMNQQLALLPEGCTVIPNGHGTAPGMWMKKSNTVYISMPGVPFEMKAMITDHVLPKIKGEYKLPFIYHKTVLTQGIGESALATMIEEWEDALAAKNIKLAYLPQPGIVKLRLSCYGSDAGKLRQEVETAILELQPIISKYIYAYEDYGEENITPEKVLSELLRSRNETVALAESCTGGYISSLLTAIPGASRFFAGGIVPYSNQAKHRLLEVDEALFTTVGAVSRECVVQLAANVRKKFNSDYAISVSGIAGPDGGTDEKPVGTVWIAVADRDRVLPMKFRFGDNRERNIMMTGAAAVNLLRKFILNRQLAMD
jgi:nicotinamide-nucleotide amidase